MNILDELADYARERVKQAKQTASLDVVKAQALALSKSKTLSKLSNDDFAFERALRKPDISFICECKKASPSKGMIAPDFPYLEIAKEYENAGADCISVLTEPKWFLGSDRYLEEIAKTVSVPCIRKDFTVDEYMIYEAKLLGAQAVLLICSILSTEDIKKYIKICDTLGMSALVEAHNEDEIKSALNAGARIVGVNNRNLKDFTVDTDNSRRMRELVPDNVIFVSESGVRTAEDIKKLREIGVDAVLIGESLMRAADKKAKLSELRGYGNKKIQSTKIKLCGLRRPEDIDYANELSPEYIGFVFARKSKRYVTKDEARLLKARLNGNIQAVGVFVDEAIENVAELVNKNIIDMVQLHGHEDEEYISSLRQMTKCSIIKAFRIENKEDVLKAFKSSADYILLDSGTGSGQVFDWSILENIKTDRPYFLAGGLEASNVGNAIARFKPFAVDASSSLETDGYKDETKMMAFVDAVRKEGLLWQIRMEDLVFMEDNTFQRHL